MVLPDGIEPSFQPYHGCVLPMNEGSIALIIYYLFPLTGWVLSSFYRFFRYSETREIVTLVVGVIGLVSGIGIIFGWADALSEMKHNKATFFVD